MGMVASGCLSTPPALPASGQAGTHQCQREWPSRACNTALPGCCLLHTALYHPAALLPSAARQPLPALLGPAWPPSLPSLHPDAEQIGLHTFRTRVFLPNNSPVAWADGVHQDGRKPAIAAAALQACKQLHEVGGAGPQLAGECELAANRTVYKQAAALDDMMAVFCLAHTAMRRLSRL